MGLFDKAKKKKEREKEFLELDEDLDTNRGGYGPAGLDKPAKDDDDLPGMQIGSPHSAPSEEMIQKDLEIINSKLSALKSEMEAMKQRIRFIEEKLNLGEKEKLAEKYGTSSPKDTGWHY